MVKNLINEIEQAMLGSLNNEQLAQLRKVLDYTFRNIVVTEKDSVNAESNNQILVENFISAKKVEGCSPNSIAYYRSTINNALIKLGKEVIHITTDDLRHYLNTYQSESGASKVTVDNIRRILSSFFSWLEEENYIVKSPVRRIHKVKVGKTVKETYTDESLELMRDHCSNPRDLALIDLLASTGMRVGELVKLNRSDIDYHNRECIVTGKGDKQRKVYFDARTKIHLQKYINSRTDNNEALFVSLLAPYDRLQISGVEIRLRQMGKDLNIPKVHPHKFRRTLATMAIDKGMPIEQVQHLLGHQSLDTTLQYAMVNQNNVKLSHHKSLVSMSQFIEMFKEKGYPLRMLKSFADVSTGGTPSKANLEYWNGDKPWVSAEDMKNKYVYDTCEKVTEAGYATCKIIPVDTLMYVCRGSIGVMAINKIECATNQSICRAKCHDNVCNVEFLYHALMYQKDNIKKMGTGTSFKSLNQTSFSELKIELPPYNEQMKFVSIAQQADKSEFVGCKSQFIEMFGNQNTNDKGWTESLVKDEFKLSMGKTPARNNPECWDNGTHKWVSISDMSSYTRYTGDTSEYITDYAIADSGIKAVPKGTIIMSFKLSIGRTAITSEDLYTNEAIMAFAGFDEKKFNIDFLHFLIANKNWLLGAKQAVKGQTLNKESIGNAKIIIPPIEAQEEFASIYNQADKSEYYN